MEIESSSDICRRFGVGEFPVLPGQVIGVSKNLNSNVLPINGLRILPVEHTCGWYHWRGEWSDAADFFVPLCIEHLPDWCPKVIPYLHLPPGWRIQLAPGHQDVRFDESLPL